MGISTVAGKAKVVGTLMGITGAMLLTFCKGAVIHIWSKQVNLMKLITPNGRHAAASNGSLVLGCIFAMGTCLSFSVWLIIQAKMSARYPCPYSSTALMSTMAAIQSAVFTICVEKDWRQWRLGWNIRLFTTAYSVCFLYLFIRYLSRSLVIFSRFNWELMCNSFMDDLYYRE